MRERAVRRWQDDPDLVDRIFDRAANRALPSRSNRPSEDWPAGAVVVLRCGAGRHRHPPRVGEVFDRNADTVIKRTQGPRRDRRRLLIITEYGGRRIRSVRFPCRDDCPADWNRDTATLEAAYRRAVAERKRELTFGVDL
jgi:hypothetical protein